MGTEMEKIEWAKMLATSPMLPPQYRGHPENLFYAAEYADAMGVPRISVLTSIYVVDGKPTAQADVIQALVRKAGHRVRVETAPDRMTVTARLCRKDDPDYWFEATWDMERARQAGLVGKSNWKLYPTAMLTARAITEVCRMGAADALLGILYTPEELGAVVNEDGIPDQIEAAAGSPIEDSAEPSRDWKTEIAGVRNLDELRTLWAVARDLGALAEAQDGQTVREMLEARAHDFTESPPAGGVAEAQLATIDEWRESFSWNTRALMAHVRKVIGEHVNDVGDLTEDEAARVIVSLAALEQAPGEASEVLL